MPEALQKQIDPIKAFTRAMGLVGIEQDGVESDDLLASQAVALARAGHEVLIVSADKDFAQIVDERIKILLPPPSANPKLGWRVMDAAGVKEKFGVPPSQIADYLALVGALCRVLKDPAVRAALSGSGPGASLPGVSAERQTESRPQGSD